MRAEDLVVEGVAVTHRTVRAGALDVHLVEAGDGPPLVLQHGWPQHWWAWRKVLPALAERFRVIVPDLRGHGWTSAPVSGYDKQQLADDLLATLDALGIERASVVGHDWGGFAAQLAALKAPERIERLVAMNIVTPWTRIPTPTPLAVAKLSYQYAVAPPVLGAQVVRFAPLVRTVLSAGVGPRFKWAPGAREAYADRFKEPARAAATSALYRTFLLREAKGLGRETRALAMPALLLTSEHDPVIPPERQQGVLGTDVTTGVIAGVGHFTPEEAPDEVAARLLEFLAPAA